ncbi:MAG: hypothetical protein ACK421_08460 [Pseudanabaenaceae cyanobacterium]
MVQTMTRSLTLTEFLQLPETAVQFRPIDSRVAHHIWRLFFCPRWADGGEVFSCLLEEKRGVNAG